MFIKNFLYDLTRGKAIIAMFLLTVVFTGIQVAISLNWPESGEVPPGYGWVIPALIIGWVGAMIVVMIWAGWINIKKKTGKGSPGPIKDPRKLSDEENYG